MSKITENEHNYSEKVSNRMIELIEQNKLFYNDELHLIEVLFKKYELLTIQDYATLIGKTYNGVKYMIKQNELAVIDICGNTFVIKALN